MIQLLLPLLSLAASPPDSVVLAQVRGVLSRQDTLGAIDLLQDWSEGHSESPAVAGLLDELQLPDASTPLLLPDSAKPMPSTSRLPGHSWSVLGEALLQPDRDLPALGGLDVSRSFPLKTPIGSTNLLAGLSGGSWMEGTDPYASADLWTGIEFRRPEWIAVIDGWGGWTERNQPEAGLSGDWRLISHPGDWNLRQGPMARWSWRLTRYLGWSANASRRIGTGDFDLGGAVRLREDPPWTSSPALDSLHASFARARLQTTLHAALAKNTGSFTYGPEMEFDGRISATSDHWKDSTSDATARRSDAAFTPVGLLRWHPKSSWWVEGELGWNFVARWGEPELDLSPFEAGPFLRISFRSDI